MTKREKMRKVEHHTKVPMILAYLKCSHKNKVTGINSVLSKFLITFLRLGLKGEDRNQFSVCLCVALTSLSLISR